MKAKRIETKCPHCEGTLSIGVLVDGVQMRQQARRLKRRVAQSVKPKGPSIEELKRRALSDVARKLGLELPDDFKVTPTKVAALKRPKVRTSARTWPQQTGKGRSPNIIYEAPQAQAEADTVTKDYADANTNGGITRRTKTGIVRHYSAESRKAMGLASKRRHAATRKAKRNEATARVLKVVDQKTFSGDVKGNERACGCAARGRHKATCRLSGTDPRATGKPRRATKTTTVDTSSAPAVTTPPTSRYSAARLSGMGIDPKAPDAQEQAARKLANANKVEDRNPAGKQPKNPGAVREAIAHLLG